MVWLVVVVVVLSFDELDGVESALIPYWLVEVLLIPILLMTILVVVVVVCFSCCCGSEVSHTFEE